MMAVMSAPAIASNAADVPVPRLAQWYGVRFAVLLTAVYAVVLSVGLSRHEIWRDEAKAWCLARESASLGELLHNRRYEGHPMLWYLLLFGASRINADPVAMQVVHGCIAVGAVAVFALFSPFGRVHKLLFAFGVFPLFEYGIVSRGYALGAVLLFLLLAVLRSPRRRPVVAAALLALLASTSLYGLFLGVACLLVWVVRDIQRRRSGELRLDWRDAAAGGLALAGLVAGFVQILPPPPKHAAPDATRLHVFADNRFAGSPAGEAVAAVWRGAVPVPPLRQSSYLYGNVLDADSGPRHAAAVIGAVMIVVAAGFAFRRSAPALVFLLCGTLLLVAFAWLKYAGSLRHEGHLFLVLIGAAWLGWPEHSRRDWRAWALTALLAVHAAVGVWFYARDVAAPFAPGDQAAAVLRARYGGNFVLVAEPGNYASPLTAHLGVPAYFPTHGRFAAYELLDGTPKWATREQVRQALRTVAAASDKPVVFLSNRAVQDADETIRLTPIFSSGPTLSGEQIELYEVERN